MNDLAVEAMGKGSIFSFRIDDKHVGVGIIKQNTDDLTFSGKTLAGARFAKDKSVR